MKKKDKSTKADKGKIIDFLKQACKDQSRNSDTDYELEHGYRNVNIHDDTLYSIQNSVFKAAGDENCQWITPEKQLHMTINSEKFSSGKEMSKMLRINDCELHAKLTTDPNDYIWGSWIAVPMQIQCSGKNVPQSSDGKCHVSLMKLTIDEDQLDTLVAAASPMVQRIHSTKKVLNEALHEDGANSDKYQSINSQWTQLVRNNAADKAAYDNLIPAEIQRCKDIVTNLLTNKAQTIDDITIKAINAHHHLHHLQHHMRALVEESTESGAQLKSYEIAENGHISLHSETTQHILVE